MKTLLLDIGNVLVHFDFAPAGQRLAQCSRVDGDPMDQLRDLKYRLETGAIAGADFVESAIEALGFRGTPAEFRRIWEEIFSPNLPMWNVVEVARGRYRLLLLSDTSEIHHQSLLRDFPVFAHFEGGSFSYRAGCLKPDPEFYRLAIEEHGLVPAETLYADDRPDNVAAGERAGLVSLLYAADRHDEFLSAARERGFDLDPGGSSAGS